MMFAEPLSPTDAAAANTSASTATPTPAGATDGGTAHRALLLQARVLSHPGFGPAATAFTTELAAVFGATRVTVGFLRRTVIDLAAVSHGHGDALVGPGFAAIGEAMDEAVQQGASIHLPSLPGGRSLVRMAHARLQQRQGGSVATVPLLHAGEVVGAVTCEWSSAPGPLEPWVQRLETLANLVAPTLHLMRLREAPWLDRVQDACRRGWRAVAAVRDRRVQAAIAAASVALLAACAVPVSYTIGGHARIEGLLQRSLAAPADGFLKAVHVRPGDRVVQGQVLVELADQDLVLQRRKWSSELAQQESAHAQALARADRAALVVALGREEQARAELALVDADIARTRIVAPFDGVVIQGDLAQAIGSPVERGRPLLMLAPGDAFRVVVEVDERDIGSVRAGQPGTLALAALPWDTLPIRVVRVTPVAHAVDGSNVFDVEAGLAPDAAAAAAAARIRPGLEGVGKLTVGERPWAWSATHRAADWLRLKLWSWWS